MTELTKADCEGITPRHISNLRIHADYVGALPFIDMSTFAVCYHLGWQSFGGVNDCGTPMCAIGHVPHNKMLDVDFSGLNKWGDVSRAAFGFDHWNDSDALATLSDEVFGDDVPSNPLTVANGMRKAADMLEAAIRGSE